MRHLIYAVAIGALAVMPAGADVVDSATEFVDNATYSAEGHMIGYARSLKNQTDTIDDKHIQLFSRLEMDTFAGLTDELFLNFKAQAIATTARSEARGLITPPGNEKATGKWVDINHLFLSFEQDDYTVTVGKAPIEVGLSTLYSPADRFNFAAGANPIFAETFGQWQARFDLFVGDDTASLIILPFEEREQSASGKSRWQGTSGDDAFFGLEIPGVPTGLPTLIEEQFRRKNASNVGYMAKYEGVREGFDFYGLMHVGPSIYPVLKSTGTVNRFIKVKPWAISPAVGAAVTIGEWELHTDVIYQHTSNREDDRFLKFVVGGSLRETNLAEMVGLEEITPLLEVSQDAILARQSAGGFIVSSGQSRPHRQTVLGRITFRESDEWSFDIAATYNFRDDDSTVGGKLTYEPDDNNEFSLSGTHYDGEDNTQFGRWRRNDYIGLGYLRNF